MRVVNLAKRPFHNRRPVARLAAVLWVLGVLLLAANLWKWGGHFRGSSDSGDRLDLLQRQVSQEEQKLDEYWQELRRVRLGARNQKAQYLNLLIHRRTFPWSRLFDQLEEVLPENVYLENVVPDVQLAKESRRGRTTRSTRARTAKQARERARQRALGQSAQSEEPEDEPQAEEKAVRDRIVLNLGGIARTEEALHDFLRRLYGHESFLDPNFDREETETTGGPVKFRIRVVYLTPPRETFPVQLAELPPAEGETSGDTSVSGDTSTSGDSSATETSSQPAPPEGSQPADVGSAVAAATPSAEGETRTSVAAEEEGESKELLERRGRDFVQDTLRDRRERAERRAAARAAAREREARESEAAERETSRPTSRTGPSRVSVAPRPRGTTVVPSAAPEARPQAQPETRSAPEPRQTRSRPDRRTTRPDTTRPETTPVDRPEPTQPGASSSPRLRGMLEWLPDFLRPELTIPTTEANGEAA